MKVAVILFCILKVALCKSITITWSTPEGVSQPSTGKETLHAIQTHLYALYLANYVPRLLSIQNDISIKLCPPQPFDPLIKEFTIPRLAAYSLIYDHDCIQQKDPDQLSIKWGFKPKKPAPNDPGKPHPPDYYGSNGLSVPKLILEIYKQKNDKEKSENNQIWLIDSDSLNTWFKAPTLNFFTNSVKYPNIPPPADLMRQINSMYGDIGEADLKNIPQAIQSACLIILPDYSSWRKEFNPKTLFNPTWWITRNVPQDKAKIIKLIKRLVKVSRISDQLIIIHHDPSPFNFEIVSELTNIYGEKNLISSTRVLPKTFSTFQVLQFIQKAAILVLDTRDLLGEMALLTTGFTNRVFLIQNHLSYTSFELVLITLFTVWLITILSIRAYFTKKHYDMPLHSHLLSFALYAILAISPIIILTPALWPRYISSTIFTLYEAGFGTLLYDILAFYGTAGLITIIVVLYEKSKSSNAISDIEDDVTISEDEDQNNDETNLLVSK